MTRAAHDTAYWNPGDRDIRPTADYVADGIEALLTGTVATFLGRYDKPRRGFDVAPRGPVAVVAASELGGATEKKALRLLERRGYHLSIGDPKRYPHGAKEGFISNPALVRPVGGHRIVRLAPADPKGRRNGRKGYVDLAPMYLHLQDYENLATGEVVTSWVIHYNPSVNKNAARTIRAATVHGEHLARITGPAAGGGDFNTTSDTRYVRGLRVNGWVNSQDAFGEVRTFRHKNGKLTAIDWALWHVHPAFEPVGQVVIDFPGQERGKTEHFVLVLEADVRGAA